MIECIRIHVCVCLHSDDHTYVIQVLLSVSVGGTMLAEMIDDSSVLLLLLLLLLLPLLVGLTFVSIHRCLRTCVCIHVCLLLHAACGHCQL